ncbi:hypothetical protein [Bacillus sp. E(2018)]|nr:hypothetical protein [Bacillus sp. E(2018)]
MMLKSLSIQIFNEVVCMRLLHLLEDILKEDIYKRGDEEQVKNV